MGKYSAFLKGLAVAGLICVGSLQVAKADMLPAGPSYTALITYDGTNSSSGYFATSATETVTFSNIGGSGGVGIQIGTYPSSVPGNGDVYACTSCIATQHLLTTSPFFVYLTASSTGLVISGSNSAPIVGNQTNTTYSGSLDQVCILGSPAGVDYPNNSCNTNQGTYYVSYASGSFNIISQSLGVMFTVTPVGAPEPSSLPMLGVGLMGLLGFGLRRKGLV